MPALQLVALRTQRAFDGARHVARLQRAFGDAAGKAAPGMAGQRKAQHRHAGQRRRAENPPARCQQRGRGLRPRRHGPVPERPFDEPPACPGQQEGQPDQPRRQQGRQRPHAADAGKGQQRLVPEIGRIADQPHRHRGPPGQKPGNAGAFGREQQDQHRPEHGRQGMAAGKGNRLVVEKDRAQHQRQPQRRRGPVPLRRPPGQEKRCRGPRQKLPGPGRQQVEIRGRAHARRPVAQDQAGHARRHDDLQHPDAPEPPDQDQRERKDQVELFLHREAPGVQQRVLPGFGGEIIGVLPEQDVGGEKHHRRHRMGEIGQFAGRHPGPGEGQARGQHEEQRGQDAPRPPLVEPGDRKAPRRDVGQQDRGDEMARNDEEHVDARKPAAEARHPGMEQDDGDHGDRAQAVDLGAVGHRAVPFSGRGPPSG